MTRRKLALCIIKTPEWLTEGLGNWQKSKLEERGFSPPRSRPLLISISGLSRNIKILIAEILFLIATQMGVHRSFSRREEISLSPLRCDKPYNLFRILQWYLLPIFLQRRITLTLRVLKRGQWYFHRDPFSTNIGVRLRLIACNFLLICNGSYHKVP